MRDRDRDNKLDLEFLLEVTLREAPKVYRIRGSRIWNLETEEDYVQEALMHISSLYERGYFDSYDETKGSIYNLVNTLLTGTFNLNRFNVNIRDRFKDVLRLEIDDLELGAHTKEIVEGLDAQLVEKPLSPEEMWEVVLGQGLLEVVMDEVLDKSPPETRKYKYLGESREYGEFELSEYNLVLYKLRGFDIAQIVGFFNPINVSQENFIRRVGQRAETKLVEALKTLDKDSRKAIIKYLENI